MQPNKHATSSSGLSCSVEQALLIMRRNPCQIWARAPLRSFRNFRNLFFHRLDCVGYFMKTYFHRTLRNPRPPWKRPKRELRVRRNIGFISPTLLLRTTVTDRFLQQLVRNTYNPKNSTSKILLTFASVSYSHR